MPTKRIRGFGPRRAGSRIDTLPLWRDDSAAVDAGCAASQYAGMTTAPFSYTSGTSDAPLLGLTIGDLFDRTATLYANNEALVSRHQNLRYTYRQLQAEVDRCARALIALGVEKGQRIGIWAPNGAEGTITQVPT